MPEPAYIRLYNQGQLEEKVVQAIQLLEECRLCPRQCGVDRLHDEKGLCRTGRRAIVASFHAHHGEESPLVGRFGSGTIFFGPSHFSMGEPIYCGQGKLCIIVSAEKPTEGGCRCAIQSCINNCLVFTIHGA
jgi:uncharacterized Fe-S radical SAM superfamily protein PflX